MLTSVEKRSAFYFIALLISERSSSAHLVQLIKVYVSLTFKYNLLIITVLFFTVSAELLSNTVINQTGIKSPTIINSRSTSSLLKV